MSYLDGMGVVLPFSLSSDGPVVNQFGCYDQNGWRIVIENGSLSPCFIDGVLLLIPSIILVLLGPLQIYNLKKRDAIDNALNIPWHAKARFVS